MFKKRGLLRKVTMPVWFLGSQLGKNLAPRKYYVGEKQEKKTYQKKGKNQDFSPFWPLFYLIYCWQLKSIKTLCGKPACLTVVLHDGPASSSLPSDADGDHASVHGGVGAEQGQLQRDEILQLVALS